MVWHPVKPRPGSLYYHLKQGTIWRNPLKISIGLHSLIPPKSIPFNDPFCAAGAFFYGQTCADVIYKYPSNEECQGNHQASLRNRALHKEGRNPFFLNFHSATDSFGLEKIEDLKNQTSRRKPKQVREVVHVGNKSFEI